MKHLRWSAWAALLSMFATGVPLAAGTTAATSATSQDVEADLEVLADFFVPSDAVRRLTTGGCGVAYRTKLDKEPEVEQAIPGIHDRMVAAASEYCAASVTVWLNEAHSRARDHWRSLLSPSDLHRLAALLAKPAAEANALKIEVRPGETLKSAVQRADTEGPAQEADLRRRELAFARTPGGARLLEMVSAYQDEWQKEVQGPDGPVKILTAAIQVAHAAANEYAKEKGFEPLYP